VESIRRTVEVPAKGIDLVHVDASHVDLIESAFGVVERFWRNRDDFVRRSNAVLALVEGQAAALCYAAAVADGRAEIDSLTAPAYRKLGLGKTVMRLFCKRCFDQNVIPLTDGFTNNAGSLGLIRSCGFIPQGDPYPFFTINR